jgi:hypothetical protein
MHNLVTDRLLFDIEKTYEYILSIQVRLDGFSFSILSNNQSIAFKSVQLKISSNTLITRHFAEWTEQEELLQKPFKKISIVIFTEKFSLIPDDFFKESLKIEISELLFGENYETEIAVNSISKFGTRLIFALPKGLNKVILEKFGECEIIHPVKTVLNNLPETEKNGLVLLLNKNSFYAVLYNSNNILLANSFYTAHATDVVFYLLTMLKQFGIQTSQTGLFIADSINKLPKVEDALQPYFENINSLKLTPFLLEQEINNK